MSEQRSSTEPSNPAEFTREWDRVYTSIARPYDLAVRYLPVWKTWLQRALPHIEGPRVLEVSFGTGYLLSRYADRFETHGVDYNRAMARTAQRNVRRAGSAAELVQADVEHLPYADSTFDTVVNTMALSGYPDGLAALSEMKRVLRNDGRLILIDFAFPPDQNWLGTKVAALMERSGDILRDMGKLFDACNLDYTDESIGAWKSVHLYVARRAA
jgi:ubiquinone/menaquinone biosynthesis C-methylase UbiE